MVFFFLSFPLVEGEVKEGRGNQALGRGSRLLRDWTSAFFFSPPKTVAKTGKFGFLSVDFPVAGKNESGRGYLRVDVRRGVGAV